MNRSACLAHKADTVKGRKHWKETPARVTEAKPSMISKRFPELYSELQQNQYTQVICSTPDYF